MLPWIIWRKARAERSPSSSEYQVLNHYTRQQIENWASDFCGSDLGARLSPQLREIAPPLLVNFLEAACEPRSIEPADLEEDDVKAGMDAIAATLRIAPVVLAEVPELFGAFLENLEDQGRLSGGHMLAAYARALGKAFLQNAGGKPSPFLNPGSKLGRNDPCPCGSGLKYKKCCQRG